MFYKMVNHGGAYAPVNVGPCGEDKWDELETWTLLALKGLCKVMTSVAQDAHFMLKTMPKKGNWWKQSMRGDIRNYE